VVSVDHDRGRAALPGELDRFVQVVGSASGPDAPRPPTAGPVAFQGHVLTSGDFLTTWAVELAVHHLDLGRDLDITPPTPESLAVAHALLTPSTEPEPEPDVRRDPRRRAAQRAGGRAGRFRDASPRR